MKQRHLLKLGLLEGLGRLLSAATSELLVSWKCSVFSLVAVHLEKGGMCKWCKCFPLTWPGANRLLQGSAYCKMVFRTWNCEKRVYCVKYSVRRLCTCVKYRIVLPLSLVHGTGCYQEVILVQRVWRAKRFKWVVDLRNVIVNIFVARIQMFNSNSLEN